MLLLVWDFEGCTYIRSVYRAIFRLRGVQVGWSIDMLQKRWFMSEVFTYHVCYFILTEQKCQAIDILLKKSCKIRRSALSIELFRNELIRRNQFPPAPTNRSVGSMMAISGVSDCLCRSPETSIAPHFKLCTVFGR